MDSSATDPLRSLPRAFLESIPDPAPQSIPIPDDEHRKFRKVLRLVDGDEVAILPGDGRLLRCTLIGMSAEPSMTLHPNTESAAMLTVGLGLPKPDALDSAIRMGTELGVASFELFPAERTVVRWDESKKVKKLERLKTIAREASEVSFRVRLPEIRFVDSLETFLRLHPECRVLSEYEDVSTTLADSPASAIAIGPEGGWTKREMELIGNKAITLGSRVLRVDTAVAAACAISLLDRR